MSVDSSFILSPRKHILKSTEVTLSKHKPDQLSCKEKKTNLSSYITVPTIKKQIQEPEIAPLQLKTQPELSWENKRDLSSTRQEAIGTYNKRSLQTVKPRVDCWNKSN